MHYMQRIETAARGRAGREAREKAPTDLVMELYKPGEEPSPMARLLGPSGPLAGALPGYQVRHGQVAVAELIWETLCEGGRAAIEAPTGIGKTHAALIPGIWWSLSHNHDDMGQDDTPPFEPLVYSVSQLALQDQAIFKDLPLLHKALPEQFRSAYLKGRSNWACNRDLPGTIHPRGKMAQWLATDQGAQGDISTAPFPIPADMLAAITTEAEDCDGSACACFWDCYYYAARRRCRTAHVVLVNHTLLILNALTGGILFGTPGAIIVDEAHKLEEVARGALSVVVTAEEVMRAVKGARWGGISDDHDVGACVSAAKAVEKELRTCFGDLREKHRITDPTAAKHLQGKVRLLRQKLEVILQDMQDALRYEGSEEQARQSIPSVKLLWEALRQYESGELINMVSWVERPTPRSSPELHIAPLSVADWLRENLWGNTPSVLMSATMISTAEAGFSTITDALGFDEPAELVAPPAFNPREQVRYIIPTWRITEAPRDAKAWCNELQGPMFGMLQITDGRSFLLFTSTAVMKEIAIRLRKIAPPHWTILVQGEGGLNKRELVEAFKAATHPVLLGLKTFWEGVDVTGDQLLAVHVDRIPFSAPGEPVEDALLELAGGKSALITWKLPRAVIELKQAFGRVLRSETKRGLFVMHDPRLRHANYRSLILKAMPGYVEPLEGSQFPMIPAWLAGTGPAPRYEVGF